MNFSKKYFFVFYLVSSFFTINSILAQGEVECNIVFPDAYESQGVKIYQAGEILYTEIDTHTLSFFVKDHKRERSIYFVIVRPSDVTYKFKSSIDAIKQQTIDSIHIAPNCSYKSYKVSIAKNENWTISEHTLDKGVIPDTAVLIFYNPLYIENCTVVDNKLLQFHVINDLVENERDKDQLFTEEVMYLFDTLHADPLYQKSSYRVVIGNAKCKQVIHV